MSLGRVRSAFWSCAFSRGCSRFLPGGASLRRDDPALVCRREHGGTLGQSAHQRGDRFTPEVIGIADLVEVLCELLGRPLEVECGERRRDVFVGHGLAALAAHDVVELCAEPRWEIRVARASRRFGSVLVAVQLRRAVVSSALCWACFNPSISQWCHNASAKT
jgi:hypothetical protein